MNDMLGCLYSTKNEARDAGNPLQKKKKIETIPSLLLGEAHVHGAQVFFLICVVMVGSVTSCFRIGSPFIDVVKDER
jgi:hypothetical protein